MPATAELWEDVVFLCLVAGCAADLASRQVPNRLCAAICAAGLLRGLTLGGAPQLGWALCACALALALTLPLYACRAMAGGDVKFFAALATFLPPSAIFPALLTATSFGGLLALGVVLLDTASSGPARERPGAERGQWLARLTTWGETLGRWPPPRPRRRTPAPTVPYAFALSLGVWAMHRLPHLYR